MREGWWMWGRERAGGQGERVEEGVDGGAAWGGHWGLQNRAPLPVPIPATVAERTHGHIDGFLFSRLGKETLSPSPEAPRHTLIRRASLDLTGLPPLPEDVDLFVNDSSPDAYERLIDRLMASAEVCERMSWEWTEAARYADSTG